MSGVFFAKYLHLQLISFHFFEQLSRVTLLNTIPTPFNWNFYILLRRESYLSIYWELSTLPFRLFLTTILPRMYLQFY